ncbi:MAG: hypothetical protein KDB45_15125, partial [Mycobacterium sp.]|nr:hypothetical protein [Mycobacterium sp.]
VIAHAGARPASTPATTGTAVTTGSGVAAGITVSDRVPPVPANTTGPAVAAGRGVPAIALDAIGLSPGTEPSRTAGAAVTTGAASATGLTGDTIRGTLRAICPIGPGRAVTGRPGITAVGTGTTRSIRPGHQPGTPGTAITASTTSAAVTGITAPSTITIRRRVIAVPADTTGPAVTAGRGVPAIALDPVGLSPGTEPSRTPGTTITTGATSATGAADTTVTVDRITGGADRTDRAVTGRPGIT